MIAISIGVIAGILQGLTMLNGHTTSYSVR